jgi:hypothetical protein
MAEILRYVDPNSSGGNGTTNALSGANAAYASLYAWNAAEAQDLTDAGGDTARVVCSSDDAGSTHAADTTAVVIDGWTTSATCYITIEAASSHGGKWNDNIYRIQCAPAVDVIHILEQYVRVIGLQVYYNALPAGLYAYGFWLDGSNDTNSDVRISKCIIKRVAGMDKAGTGIEIGGFKLTAWNNIIYDFDTGHAACGIYAKTSAHFVYNNTIINCYNGIMQEESGSVVAINNIVKGSGNTNAYVGTFTTSDYNATDGTDTGDGGAHSRQSQTFTFVNEGADDFHLASTDAGARDYGVSDPGSGLFSDDIDGVARTGTWDIGADEYVASSSAAVTGTEVGGITEADRVTGGKVLTVVLTGETFIA